MITLALLLAGWLLGVGTALAAALYDHWRRAAADPGEAWPETDHSEPGDEVVYPPPELSRREQGIYDQGWGAGYTYAALHPEPEAWGYRLDPPESRGGG